MSDRLHKLADELSTISLAPREDGSRAIDSIHHTIDIPRVWNAQHSSRLCPYHWSEACWRMMVHGRSDMALIRQGRRYSNHGSWRLDGGRSGRRTTDGLEHGSEGSGNAHTVQRIVLTAREMKMSCLANPRGARSDSGTPLTIG
jgi:hypothetical protein